jgi:acyl carrier protein
VQRLEVERWIEKRQDVLDRLRAILVRGLRAPLPMHAIEPDVILFGTGLALDSLDALELIVAAEQEFDVELSDREVEQHARTLNALADLILARQEKR